MLKNFKPDYNNIDYDNLIEFLTDFNLEVILKYKNTLNFGIYKLPKSEDDCKGILKKWCYLFRKKSKYFEDKLLKVVDEVIDDTNLDNSSYISKVGEKYILKYDISIERDVKINKILR